MMTKISLDAFDIAILSALQQHGQLSKNRLAEIVNLSPTPCWSRLNRLKSAGYVKGYSTDIALERIVDFTQVIVTISLSHHRKADFDRFENRIRVIDEITECVATGGGMDYILRVITPNLEAFQQLMDSLNDDEMGINRYLTYIVTRQVKKVPPNLAQLTAPIIRQREKD